jgi:hypothetical protein
VATDPSTNSATCTQVISVADTINPTITCPANKVLDTDAGQNFATVAAGWATFTNLNDDVEIASTVTTPLSHASGHTLSYAAYSTPVNFTSVVTDTSGNSATCTFTVQVRDNESPNLSCSDLTAQTDAGSLTGTVTLTTAVTLLSDAVDTTLVVGDGTFNPSQSTFTADATSVTYVVQDASGNGATCTFTVTVTKRCGDAYVNDAEECETSGTGCTSSCTCDTGYQAFAPAETNCELIVVPPTGDFLLCDNEAPITVQTALPANTTTKAYCFDGGNLDACRKQAATWVSASRYSVNTAGGWEATDVTVTCSHQSGDSFYLGTTTVQCTGSHTEPANGQIVCQWSVIVEDKIKPYIHECPTSPQSFDTDAGEPNKFLTWSPASEDESGNPASPVIAKSGQTGTNLYPVGDTQITWTAQDNAGNTATCQFTVTVSDNEDPTIDACVDLPFSLAQGQSTKTLSSYGTWSDNVQVNGTLTTYNPALPATFNVGSTSVTTTATDTSGNSATCSFNVIVRDVEAPTCHASLTTKNVNTDGAATGTATWTAGGSDNVGGSGGVSVLSASHQSGAAFAIGSHTVTIVIEDGSNNEATCQFQVIVTDNNDPAISCPASATVFNTVGVTYSDGALVASATDNDPTFSAVPSTTYDFSGSPTVFPLGSTTVTYTVSDPSNNSATCSFTLNVIDGVDPVCVSNNNPFTLTSSPILTPPLYGSDGPYVVPQFSDNVGIVNTTSDGDAQTQLSLGLNTHTYIASDAEGNQGTCFVSITVVDGAGPTFIGCPADSTLEFTTTAPSFSWAIDVADDFTIRANIVVADDTGASRSLSGTENLNVGVHSFSFTATDEANNANACSFTVTVVDYTPPVVSCPSDISVRSTNEANTATNIAWGSHSATDNVALSSQGFSPPASSTFLLGPTTVTLTATDTSGLQATCTFTVTVLEAYALPSLYAVLTKVAVVERSPGNYGADIEYLTQTNWPHRAFLRSAGHTGTGLDDTTLAEIEAGTVTEGQPLLQKFAFAIDFPDCNFANSVYSIQHYTDCTPSNCLLGEFDWQVNIELAAENYCGTELAVTVAGALTLTSAAEFTTYSAAAALLSVGLPDSPAALTVANNGDTIFGVVEVSSPDVLLASVTLLNAKRYTYTDAGFSEGALVSIVDFYINEVAQPGATGSNNREYAHFEYTEADVPVLTTYFTKVVATVRVDYQLQAGGRRRSLLHTITSESHPDALRHLLNSGGRMLLQDDEETDLNVNSQYLSLGEDPSVQEIEQDAVAGDGFAVFELCGYTTDQTNSAANYPLVNLNLLLASTRAALGQTDAVDRALYLENQQDTRPTTLLALVRLRNADADQTAAWISELGEQVKDPESLLQVTAGDSLCITPSIFYGGALNPVIREESEDTDILVIVVCVAVGVVLCMGGILYFVLRKQRDSKEQPEDLTTSVAVVTNYPADQRLPWAQGEMGTPAGKKPAPPNLILTPDTMGQTFAYGNKPSPSAEKYRDAPLSPDYEAQAMPGAKSHGTISPNLVV